MIVIIDYEMRNLRLILKTFDQKGIETLISNNPLVIEKADKLILPGIGHFKTAMEKFGAGETIINSIDDDGMMSGYDIPLVRLISE